jgi:hypothetical protein
VVTGTAAELGLALRDGGLVLLAYSGTIQISNTITIATETILDGSGSQVSLAPASTNVSRLFLVLPGASLTLRNLSVTGGAIAPVTSTNAVSGRNGDAATGAGLYIDHGSVTLDGCTFSSHRVVGGQGATATTAAGNGGDGGVGAGAAIFNFGGQLLVTNCTFRGNQAAGGAGGNGALPLASGNGGNGGEVELPEVGLSTTPVPPP